MHKTISHHKKALVCGAGKFIGGHLAQRLKEEQARKYPIHEKTRE